LFMISAAIRLPPFSILPNYHAAEKCSLHIFRKINEKGPF
jgi:hypothetical protein